MKKQTRKNLEYLIQNLSRTKINNFVELLENGKLSTTSTNYELTKKLSLTTSEVEIIRDVLRDVKNIDELTTALTLLSEIRKLEQEKLVSTSLVWTSPIFFHEDADKTKQVITDLFLKAKTSITIVGYAMTSDKYVQEIFEILQQNVNINKINIKFIWEQAEKQKIHGKKQPSVKEIIRKNWDKKITFPKIYTYEVGRNSSLHAKALIIDSKEILITSANMTGRGMTWQGKSQNLEMGLRHTGKAAKECEELIQALINEHVITQV